jgi:tRNA A-37 threonylcarbamoyl transferase component Bud32
MEEPVQTIDPCGNAESLWTRAKNARPVAAGETDLATNLEWLLKTESRVRVLLHAVDGDADGKTVRLVSKIYRTPPALAWRTFGLVSRAKREFKTLAVAFERNVPVVQPFGWSDTRLFGCVRCNQLTMAYVPGETLIEFMQRSSQAGGPDQDQADGVVTAVGELLASLHRAGIVWGTAVPRNVMVFQSGPGPFSVAAFDFPYASCLGSDVSGSRFAHTDLWWMAGGCAIDCGFDDRMLELFYSAYIGDTGIQSSELRSTVEQLTNFQRLANRIRGRIAQAFRKHL